MFWVALAGPLSNVILALASTVLLGFAFAYWHQEGVGNGISQLLRFFIPINLFLAIFNLLPIHPLDGAKVIEPFLPYAWNRWLDEHQWQLNMGLLMLFLLGGSILAWPVGYASEYLYHLSGLISASLGYIPFRA